MNQNKKLSETRAAVFFVSAMLVFGTIGIFRRYIPVSSAFLACVRGILGGIFLLLVQAVMHVRRADKGDGRKTEETKEKSKLPRKTFFLLVIIGIAIGFNWILLFEAYNYTTVPIATICYYMQPTIVILLSPIVFRERLTFKKGMCAFFAIFGMVLVSGVIGGSGADTAVNNTKGIILGLGSALLYATVVILNKKISGVDPYQKTTIQLLSAGLVMIPYMLLTGDAGMTSFDARTILLLLVVGIVHTGIAYVVYFWSFESLKAQSVAILSYIDPVSAVIFAAIFLGEALSIPGMVGAAFIIGSAIISER